MMYAMVKQRPDSSPEEKRDKNFETTFREMRRPQSPQRQARGHYRADRNEKMKKGSISTAEMVQWMTLAGNNG